MGYIIHRWIVGIKFIVEYGELCGRWMQGRGNKMVNDGNGKDMEKTELYNGKSMEKWVKSGEMGTFVIET